MAQTLDRDTVAVGHDGSARSVQPSPAFAAVPPASLRNGPAAAALLAGGIGAAALGIFTTAAEMVAGIKTALTWNNAVGPLSGKTGLAIIVWLVAWAALHFVLWRGKDVALGKITLATYILFAIGLLFTFPPLYQRLAGG